MSTSEGPKSNGVTLPRLWDVLDREDWSFVLLPLVYKDGARSGIGELESEVGRLEMGP